MHTLIGVTEYCEEMAVSITETPDAERLVVRALNEGGHNSTEVDLLQLIAWLKTNKPELLK